VFSFGKKEEILVLKPNFIDFFLLLLSFISFHFNCWLILSIFSIRITHLSKTRIKKKNQNLKKTKQKGTEGFHKFKEIKMKNIKNFPQDFL